MLNRLTTVALIIAFATAASGFGYGAWRGREARRAAQEVRVIAEQLEAEKSALRAADAAAGALSRRLKAAQALAQEKQRHDSQDAKALAEAQEWADSPIPEPIRLRLLDN